MKKVKFYFQEDVKTTLAEKYKVHTHIKKIIKNKEG